MADKRSEYEVEIGGVKHAFLLTEEDAKRYPNATKKSGAAKSIAEEAARATAAAGEAISTGRAAGQKDGSADVQTKDAGGTTPNK